MGVTDFITKEVDFHEVIVRDAQALAKIVGMDLYIGSAYSVEIDAANLPVKGHGHEVNVESIAELYGLEADRVYLRKGATLDTLEEICNEVDPSIVIMGTLARGGVSGMLIGNTAEKLLDIIDADILTVN